MFTNFFQARDAWDAELLADDSPASREDLSAYAIFRVLLEHTMWKKTDTHTGYGWVLDAYCPQETLGKLTGISRRQTVGKALGVLEERKLIQRRARRDWNKPGSEADAIKITWKPVWADDESSESAESEHPAGIPESAESAPSETESAHPKERAKSALSPPSKEVKNYDIQKGPSGDVSTPQMKTPGASPQTPQSSSTLIKSGKVSDDLVRIFARRWASHGEETALRWAVKDIKEQPRSKRLQYVLEVIRDEELLLPGEG